MTPLSEFQNGERFFCGGIEWVKLDTVSGGVLSIAADALFKSCFNESNHNDWRTSSLRHKLNGTFLDTLIAQKADPDAFLEWESDLTADNGMTDYSTVLDKIFIISDTLYRKHRQIIPKIECPWWSITPWTCDEKYSCLVRYVDTSGTLSIDNAYYDCEGVRPLCYLKEDTLVEIERSGLELNSWCEMVKDASSRLIYTLSEEYPADVWEEALQMAADRLKNAKKDAKGIQLEQTEQNKT